MYPAKLTLLGVQVSVWNAALIGAAVAGYLVLRYVSLPLFVRTGRGERAAFDERWVWVRYLVVLYACVIGAQLFAYLFDVKTSLSVPPNRHWAEYYLNPLAGSKTLYGAIALYPLGVAMAFLPRAKLSYSQACDVVAPSLFVVIAGARLGCFLQGCCYGVRSESLGLSFAERSVVYFDQVRDGLIVRGGTWSLPVLPTQLLEMGAAVAISVTALGFVIGGLGGGARVSVFAYSVFRFLVEFIRDDSNRNAYGVLSTSQWLALVLIGMLAVELILRRRKLAHRAVDST